MATLLRSHAPGPKAIALPLLQQELALLSFTGVGCFLFKKIEGETLSQQQDKGLQYHETCCMTEVSYRAPRCPYKHFFAGVWSQTCPLSEVCLYLNSALTVNAVHIDCCWLSWKGQAYFWSVSADLSKVCFSNYRGYYQAVKWII